jgi:plasmid replication initiation protein
MVAVKKVIIAKTKKKKVNDTVLIRKANDLVEARYKFDIWETRLFLKMLTMIRSDDKDFYEYKIYIHDLIKDFQLENNKDTYQRVKDGARKLMTKIIRVLVKDEGNLVELETPIIGAVKKTLDEGDGSYIKLAFFPEMKQFLLELKNRYLVYDFKNVSNLPSPYYVRIYELLKQYEKIGERRFGVTELKEMLGITTEYKLYGHFKNKILDKAQAKLEEHTDIHFTYKEIKRGRSIEGLVFYIHSNRHKMQDTIKTEIITDFEDVEEEENDENIEINPVFQTYFERLNSWWGIGKEQFLKRVGDKSPEDIDKAIHFTKERIKTGKANNPAGIFLDALSKGYKTPLQIKAEKQAQKEQLDREKRERIKPLLDEYEDISLLFSAAINNAIRDITSEDPTITEGAIDRVKALHLKMGNAKIRSKTIEDFRQQPLLREMVKSEIMRSFPEKFARINAQFSGQMQQIMVKIKAVDPSYPNEV